jgi:hypothetical protein
MIIDGMQQPKHANILIGVEMVSEHKPNNVTIETKQDALTA